MDPDTRAAIRDAIHNALRGFETGSLRDRTEELLRILGYESERCEEDFDFAPDGFLEWADGEVHDRKIAKRPRESIRDTWKRIAMVFQYTEGELRRQADLFGGHGFERGRVKSFLFLAVDLKKGDHARHRLAAMTRAINRPLMMPAIVFFRYRRRDGSSALTLAVIHRRAHKRDADRDVLERATLIKDIRVADPHRAHLNILTELALTELVGSRAFENRTFDALHRAWYGVLDTEELNRRFYTRLFEWFEYAVATCSFPNDGAGEGNAERHVIRMITRLLFIWFLKEKRLVPEEFFEEGFAEQQLRDHNPDGTDYYRAVLQNLFFATLNTPIERRAFSSASQATHRDFTKFRYRKLLRDPDGFKKRFGRVPFVNGGLFDCLDTFEHRGRGGRRIDAFTDTDQGKDLHVPASVFFDRDSGLFPILRKYKFTVEENTPLDQEVALDPELLGKTFENLLAAYNPETREHARKKTGSYYTPRDVVDYMVQEALVEHLSQVVTPYDSDEGWLKERLRHLFAINQGEGTFAGRRKPGGRLGTEDHLIHRREIDPLIGAIDSVRVLDPACGSGAFPMGILHKLVMALGKIDPRNERWKARQMAVAEQIEDPAVRRNAVRTVELAFSPERGYGDFGRKLYLIQRVMHGVDIQPIATQIAKLRFFISLVIEQPTTDDPNANFGLEPLPNLETCFVAANSLKRLSRPEQTEIRSSSVAELEKELQAHRRNWFDAHDRDAKWELKKRDRRLRRRLRRALREDQWDEVSARKIANWDAYDQNACADWFDPEWMFGRIGGFHIVIGNPPYIQLQKNGGELANRYKDDGYVTFTRTGDIYVLFCERGAELLRSGSDRGILVYITSNSWLKANYGKKLRSFLADTTTPLRLLEMGKSVFENTIVDSSVLLARRGGRADALPALDLERLPDDVVFPDLPDDVWGEVRPSGVTPWSIMSRQERTILDKMRAVGVPLRDWDDISIYYGIKTGYNPAFIISTEARDRLVAEDARSSEILKPVLRGRDIQRYRARWAGIWLIATHNGYGDVPPVCIDEYPAVKRHLDQFYGKLESRHDKGITPYNLRNCAYHAEFLREKLFWIELAEKGRFAYGTGAEFGEATTFLMTGGSLKYLCAILNSPISTWFVERTAPTSGMGTLRWKKVYVNEMPVPRLSPSEQQPFVDATDRILKTLETDSLPDVTTLEDKLHRLVYKLYGLRNDEVEIVKERSH